MKRQYEIIIIGGGPAGAAAAIYLRNYGFDVLVIEKKSFPRETLCGEFLSQEVIAALKELSLFNCFLELNPNVIENFRLADSSGKNIFTPLGFTAYGIKRGTFDQLMLNSAKEKGAEVLQPAEIISIKRDNKIFSLRAKAPGVNEIILESRIVIGAFGKQNVLDKQLERVSTKYLSRLNGVKFHVPSRLVNFKKNEIQIYTADSIYCGVNAVNENTTTLCFLEDRKQLNGSARKQLYQLADRNTAFKELFRDISEVENYPLYGTGNIFFGRKEKSVNGIFMIGDAAGVIAPLAGDGIGMAFQSAGLLARLISENHNKLHEIERLYNSVWSSIFTGRLIRAKLVQHILLKGFLRKSAVTFAGLFPGTIQNIIKSTRGQT